MPVVINWTRSPLVEDLLTRMDYAWQYVDHVPLRDIDIKGAAVNPARPHLAFIQSNADAILALMISGGAFPPPILFDDEDGGPKGVCDGLHRLDSATECAKDKGSSITGVPGYLVKNATPRRKRILAVCANRQGRTLSDAECLDFAIELLREADGEVSEEEAASYVGLDKNLVKRRWEVEQMMTRAIDLGVEDIFRRRIVARDDKKTNRAAKAFTSIQNNHAYVAAVQLCERFELNVNEMVGTARSIAETRTETAAMMAVQAAIELYTERDEEAKRGRRGRKRKRPNKATKLFDWWRKSLNLGSPHNWFDAEEDGELSNMLDTTAAMKKYVSEVEECLSRAIKERERLAAFRRKTTPADADEPPGAPLSGAD
jgi:hypothetical protein